mgnify:CR=1 FL=1
MIDRTGNNKLSTMSKSQNVLRDSCNKVIMVKLDLRDGEKNLKRELIK